MDDSVLRISLCGLSPDCEDLGFFQDVTRSPANFRCIQIMILIAEGSIRIPKFQVYPDHDPNCWRFFIKFVNIWNISSTVGLGLWTKIAKVVTMTSARRSCWPVRKATGLQTLAEKQLFIGCAVGLGEFFFAYGIFPMKSPWKTTLITRHDFDHLFRYDLKKKSSNLNICWSRLAFRSAR